MRNLVSLLILAMAGTAYSAAGLADDCHRPSAPTNFPDPATATEAEIVSTQQEVKQYLNEMESALKCMDVKHDSMGYDVAVDAMRTTAAKFNGVLHAFRAAKKSDST